MNAASSSINAMSHTSPNGPSRRTPGNAIVRHRGWIRIASIVAILTGLFLIMRTLPVEAGVDRLQGWVDAQGALGPLAYGGIYALAALLFVPGSVLTIASGALFGLWWGTLTVSLASTTAAAIAFLIGRHLARGAVQQQAAKYPSFQAVDRAIGEEGWKIVALLRLAPVFPFSIGNYLLGLTSIRFWPYVLSSWLAMLPGTFLYVYIGHVGRAGVEATGGGGGGRSTGQWIMLIVGFLAILGLVVYIVRFALAALNRHSEIESAAAPVPGESDARGVSDAAGDARSGPVVALAGAALVVLILGACATMKPGWLSGLFGPPAVVPAEAYVATPGGPAFDHSAFNDIVNRYVAEGGWVDYSALAAGGRSRLDEYLRQIAGADFESLGRDEKLALLINAYNAFTLELILEHFDGGKLRSITDIPDSKRWDDVRWNLGGHIWSLNQIEHEQIRPTFREPRVHWALVCAAVGCPPLRTEAYAAPRIDAQLQDQARAVHSDPRWFRYDRAAGVVHATELYRWYGGDFEHVDGGALRHAARYVPQLREDLEAGRTPRIEWIKYDWALNNREHVDEPDHDND